MSGLSVSNVLDSKEVVITAVVLEGDGDTSVRDRDIVVTVGIAEEQVMMDSGKLSQLQAVVERLWAQYAQMQVGAETAVDGEEVLGEAEAGELAFTYSDEEF